MHKLNSKFDKLNSKLDELDKLHVELDGLDKLYAEFDELDKSHAELDELDKKVQVGKDQEKAQSEKDSQSKNRGGKKPN